jgi:uncharacterized protein YecE (DUF72 family)
MNYIGISGWTYEPWRGTFYPEDLPQKRELEYASRQLNSIEINGTFYSLQKPGSFRTWYEQTPDDFVFSLKGGRFITHIRRLRDIETPLANFFASGVLALKQKLGPILWQFPPNFKFDAERFEPFFELLPHDTEAAAELACKHDKNWKGEVCLETDQRRPVRHAVEFRHDSFLTPDFVKLLRKHKIALVAADTAGLHPYAEDVTADFVYLRLHGAEEIYVSGYTDEALNRWADRIRAWSTGGQPADAKVVLDQPPPKCKSRDVYAYFDNDVKVRSPADAKSLAKLLSSD